MPYSYFKCVSYYFKVNTLSNFLLVYVFTDHVIEKKTAESNVETLSQKEKNDLRLRCSKYYRFLLYLATEQDIYLSPSSQECPFSKYLF